MADHTQIFSDYYANDFWANEASSSGPNSAFETTSVLRKNLQQALRQLEVKTILDLGCGDANIFGHMDLKGIDYLGIDCVPDLIEHTRKRWADTVMQFRCGDILTEGLSSVDVVICRDVLHYLPNDLIYTCLNNILKTRSRFVILTHNVASSLSANSETELGVFRPVNLTCQPFCLPEPYLCIAEDVLNKELAVWRVGQLGQLRYR